MLFQKLFGATDKPVAPQSDGKIARDDSPTVRSAVDSAVGRVGGLLADARSLSAAERRAEALALVDDGLLSMPENAELLFARASILFDWGRFREARDGYLTAAAAGLSGAALDVALGWAHLQSGDARAAVDSMRRAAALDPSGRGTRMGLATALFRLGRFTEADAAFSRLLELLPRRCRLLVAPRKLQALLGRLGGWRIVVAPSHRVRPGACRCVEGPGRGARRAGSPAGGDRRVGDGLAP